MLGVTCILKPAAGSGWIFDVQRRIIVTNAHVVEFASTLQVRKEGLGFRVWGLGFRV